MFVIQNRETGTQIDSFRTYNEAIAILKRYEEEDRVDGIYEENFYEIIEV